jgi:hypothetical protein
LCPDKPQIEELRYFLEFQIPRIWAPVQDNFPGHQRKEPVCPSLQFSMMGQKLYVSQEQVYILTLLYFLSQVKDGSTINIFLGETGLKSLMLVLYLIKYM